MIRGVLIEKLRDNFVEKDELFREAELFINSHISSVEQVEILLLLAEGGDRAWSVEQVFEKIQSQTKSVAQKLEHLSGMGILKKEGELFRYSPQTAELSRNVLALAEAYRHRRVRVIEMIYLKPQSAIQGFADAFKLRKKE